MYWLTKPEGLQVGSAQLDPGETESQGMWPMVGSLHEHRENTVLDLQGLT